VINPVRSVIQGHDDHDRCPVTCDDAWLHHITLHEILIQLSFGSPGRVVWSLDVRPFPRPCRATLIEVPAQWRPSMWTAGVSRGARTGRGPLTVMSTAEPGTRPVTFRAMFIEELRARREQTRRPQSPADGVRAPAPSNVRMPAYVMPG